MQRIRLRYTKRGRLRFTSHRDFQRAFERALRRAEVPMAYSAGFTPHPKVSYANAAPTGVGSEAEYLEIALAAARDPEALRLLLDASLPTGLDVIESVEARTPGLAERLEASVWQLRLDGVDPERARQAVAAFMAADAVEVQRATKNGVRTFDCRAAVTRFDVVDAGSPMYPTNRRRRSPRTPRAPRIPRPRPAPRTRTRSNRVPMGRGPVPVRYCGWLCGT